MLSCIVLLFSCHSISHHCQAGYISVMPWQILSGMEFLSIHVNEWFNNTVRKTTLIKCFNDGCQNSFWNGFVLTKANVLPQASVGLLLIKGMNIIKLVTSCAYAFIILTFSFITFY